MSFRQEILDKALEEFRSRVGEKNYRDFENADVNKVKRELYKLQQEQRKQKGLRNPRRMEGFIKAFEQYGEIVEVFLNASSFVCFVWGPVKFLLMVTKNHLESLDMVLDAFERIAEEMPLLNDYRNVFQEEPNIREILIHILADVLEFLQFAIKFFSGRFSFLKSLWKNHGPTFDHILSQLRSHRKLLEERAMIISSRRMKDHITQHSVDMQVIRFHMESYEQHRSDFDKKEKDRLENNHDQVQVWIASPDVECEHLDICRDRKHYPKSGDWILEQELVKNWLSPDKLTNSILWINGNPGAGKTYLASIIIEACKKESSWATSYFYCSDTSKDRDTAISVLKGILSQLVCQDREALVPCCLEKKRGSPSPSLSTPEVAKSLLETATAIIPHLYIIIDGLDECPNPKHRKLIVQTFSDLVKSCDGYSQGKLRLLFLSRPLPEAEKTSLFLEVENFSLSPENNEKDIERYCKVRFEQEHELRKFKLDAKQVEEAIEITRQRADGMFLFAKLVMNFLAKQPTRDRFFRETVSTRFPRSLDAVYSRILERLQKDLEESQFEYTQLILGWLVRSKRPLKWTEIQVAFSIDLDDDNESNELNTDLTICNSVDDLCGSLVQLLPGDRIELVHSTARVYIASQKTFDLEYAEYDLNLRCLRYLTLNIFREDTERSERNYVRTCALRGDLAFQDYAVSTWFMHLRSILEAKTALFDNETDPSNIGVSPEPGTFTYELERFVKHYRDAFPEHDISEQARRDCEHLCGFPFYDNLVRVWSHVCLHQAKDIKSRGKVSIESLDQMLQRNREVLEEISNSKSESKDLEKKYSSKKWFKCHVVFCFYFHEGFPNKKIRDKHRDCHERPYQCEVDDCGISGLGLASSKALEKHMRTFHPDQCDLSESFAQLNRKSSDAKWLCTHANCDKSFTRHHNLKSHLLNHKGEKPYQCSECGRGFARQNDVRRHEEIHNRGR